MSYFVSMLLLCCVVEVQKLKVNKSWLFLFAYYELLVERSPFLNEAHNDTMNENSLLASTGCPQLLRFQLTYRERVISGFFRPIGYLFFKQCDRYFDEFIITVASFAVRFNLCKLSQAIPICFK